MLQKYITKQMSSKMLLVLFLISILSILFKNQIARAQDDLYNAAYIADVAGVEHLLSTTKSEILTSRLPVLINKTHGEYNRTSLMVCGIDPQEYDSDPVDFSCSKIANAMIEYNADISHKDTKGWDALSFGAARGFIKFCEVLIMGGSNVDSVDIHGKTPLMKAVVNGHAALSEMLIKHGARLDLRDENELTVLHVCSQVAAKNNTFIPLLKLIIELMPPKLIDSRDKDGRTPLMHAAILGDTDVSAIALLIKSGANILLADNYGLTAAELSKVTSTAIRQYFAIAISEKIEKDHHDWLAKTEIIDTSEKKKRKSKKNELKAEGDITETKNIESKIEL